MLQPLRFSTLVQIMVVLMSLCLSIFTLVLQECPREFKRLYLSGFSESSVLLDKDKSKGKILEFRNYKTRG